jgi:hypothetical protein
VIQLSKDIFSNATLRSNLVSVAEKVTEHPETVTKYYTQNFEQEIARIDSANKLALDTVKNEVQRMALLKEIKDKKMAAANLYTQKRVDAIDSLSKQLTDTGIPLGWNKAFLDQYSPYRKDLNCWNYVWLILGWLIAAGCIAMGAPFWFDLLVKAVNLRRSGIKPTADDTKRQ